MTSIHKPVLLNEIVETFKPQGNNSFIFLDCTLGGAGHSLAIAESLKGKLTIIGLDRDPQAIMRAEKLLSGKAERIILENEDFRNLDKVLDKHQVFVLNGLLLDLGISSDELDNSGRGFSFLKDEPLLMTMGDPVNYIFTAKDIVNNWGEDTIADIIYGYGEERYSRRIARAIVNYRTKKSIETSGELSEIISMSVPPVYRRSRLHPATRTFQALRITVNDELTALKIGLQKGYEKLGPGGKMAVISFHSLEDRIVKEFNREKSKEGATIVTKKPLIASSLEIENNPRSRSAKLRIIIKNI